MSARLRQCRQGLAKALDQAMKSLPENNLRSVVRSRPEADHNASCPLHTHPPEMLSDLCLTMADHKHILTRQGSRHVLEGFTVSRPEPEHWELPARIESPGMKILDELLAKLEFENELNRVCNRLSVNTVPVRGDSTGSADNSVEDEAANGEEDEEKKRLMGMVLDMEQDYEFFIF